MGLPVLVMAMSWMFLRAVRGRFLDAREASEVPDRQNCLCRAIVWLPNWLMVAIGNCVVVCTQSQVAHSSNFNSPQRCNAQQPH